jgi:predicted class III extradiol MEMO1 family dioxygenase
MEEDKRRVTRRATHSGSWYSSNGESLFLYLLE